MHVEAPTVGIPNYLCDAPTASKLIIDNPDK